MEVVALDWKWLFIYPEQGIATVNELAAPVNRPIAFKITASSVMNSFFMPALAGQIYAMPRHGDQAARGHQQRRRLRGLLGQLQRRGLLGHALQVPRPEQTATSTSGCRQVKASQANSTREVYLKLGQSPASSEPVQRYASVDADLYDAILNRCVEAQPACASSR